MRNPDKPPICECGCGLPVRSKRNGVWSRWRLGHAYRRRQAVIRRSGSEYRPPPDPAAAPASPTRDVQLSLWPELAPPYELPW